MKAKFILILSFLVFAVPAWAGIFDFMRDPEADGRMRYEAETVEHFKKVIPQVPLKDDCAPGFAQGNDGLFRRTDYCHKANPKQAKAFLKPGYDVPASFLSGFTLSETSARWQNAQLEAPAFEGIKVELPVELFTLLNVSAAQAWDQILACAHGDADQAREMYRTGRFECAEANTIHGRLAEIRANLPVLASSFKIALFLDEAGLDELAREIRKKRDHLLDQVLFQDPERYQRESLQTLREEIELGILRQRVLQTDRFVRLEKHLPKMPRFHPLLSQILFEELFSLVSPDESFRTMAQRLKKDRSQQVYLLQLLLWFNSIEDRACAPLGLWPSAIRTAAKALSDRAYEFENFLVNVKRDAIPRMALVDCPLGQSTAPPFRNERHRFFISDEEARAMMRLSDVYYEGRHAVWRELREVRERYAAAVKR